MAMKKDVALKMRLVRDSVLMAVALTALLGVGGLLSGYAENKQEQKQGLQTTLQTMHAEYDAIKIQLGSGYEVQSFYDVYIQNHNGTFALNRELVSAWLAGMKEKHHMANLEVTLTPLSEVAEDVFKPQTGTLVKSEVRLKFGVVTDADVYALIEDLQRSFPGIVLMSEIKISRAAELSKNILVDLSQHRITPLVKGEVAFVWIGIRPKLEEKAEASTFLEALYAP
jgi:hypothetical protein